MKQAERQFEYQVISTVSFLTKIIDQLKHSRALSSLIDYLRIYSYNKHQCSKGTTNGIFLLQYTVSYTVLYITTSQEIIDVISYSCCLPTMKDHILFLDTQKLLIAISLAVLYT